MKPSTLLLLLVMAPLLATCGGGGGNNGNRPPAPQPPPGPTPPPFGLTSRPAMAPLNIPLGGGALGAYRLVASYPALSFPFALFMTAVPGANRVVVVQQDGYVRAFADDAATTTSSLVLDLSARVRFGGEEGLLGLAFDPDFDQNRYFYVHYSLGGPARSRISRFTWDPVSDAADPASEKIILEVPQPYGNHNGGMLAFGPDGFLYIGLGDGGSAGDPENRAQDTTNLHGSMLRIDVHPANPADAYDVPPDNPFAGQAGFLDEIWAYGLRNPFRFSFDRSVGTLWLGDVGELTREEIDIIERGGNYGWRVYEGNVVFDDSLNTLPPSAFTPPVLDYGRSLGVAVIGGYVYRGSRVPSLQGRYIYGDFGSGNIWALTYDLAAGVVQDNTLIANIANPVSFGEDTSADLHVVGAGGTLFRFEEQTPGTPAEPPPLLSDTGVFDDLANLVPASGFIEYELNAPFWSDGAVKRRWIAVPDGETIGFTASGAWSFPVGTVIVKHFELALREGDPASRRRLETRLLVRRSDGWRGFTYRWNGAETDADLLTGREFETITVQLAQGGSRDQLYEYPSRTDCLGCHTQAAGRVLGPRTRQINRDFAYPAATDNQLRSWNNIGLFDRDIGEASGYQAYPDPADGSLAVAPRARAWLDVNCAQCHQPGGPAPTAMDLRFDTALADMNVLDVTPNSGSLGIVDARIVAPGDRARSVLLQRILRLDGNRMPPLGSHVVDDDGAELIGRWIDGL